MSETRKLGYDPYQEHYFRSGETTWEPVDPTDAERVDLAVAALTHGTNREVPTVGPTGNFDVEYDAGYYMEQLLLDVACLRAALARDAAAKEAEREALLERTQAYDAWHAFFGANDEAAALPPYHQMVESLVRAGARAPEATS